jgi:hypothetical protein
MHWVVDRKRRVLEVWDGELRVAWFAVSIGRPESPTPRGRFRLERPSVLDDPAVVATFTTAPVRCLRATLDTASLGHAVSGG